MYRHRNFREVLRDCQVKMLTKRDEVGGCVMCGICGVYHHKDAFAINLMVDVMRHRGRGLFGHFGTGIVWTLFAL